MATSLVRLELRWKHKPKDLAPAIHSVGGTLGALDRGGFIIGGGTGVDFANAASYVHADAKAGTVSIHAWFIGPGAWNAALAEHRAEQAFLASDDDDAESTSVFSIEDFGLRKTEPEIFDRTKGLHRPAWTCQASLKSKPTLRFQVSPDMATPALISADRRLIPVWSLGLSRDTRVALHEWNVQARAVASLAPAFEDEGMYLKWASQQLRQKSSPLAAEARRLAALVTKETGCKVLTDKLIDPLGGF